jgi:hypothetical protein
MSWRQALSYILRVCLKKQKRITNFLHLLGEGAPFLFNTSTLPPLLLYFILLLMDSSLFFYINIY